MPLRSLTRSDRRDVASRRSRRRRSAAFVLAAPLLVNTVACYDYRPLAGVAPQPGQPVSLDVTDQGRVDLAEQLGAGVLRLEGTLQGIERDHYVLGVSRIAFLNGQVANWSGEKVNVPRADVGLVSERQLSKTRTALTVGAVIAAIGAFVLTRSIIGGGSVDAEKLPPGGQGT
jgi:hypothetical protein